MKHVLIVLAALVLGGLGWFLLADTEPVSVDGGSGTREENETQNPTSFTGDGKQDRKRVAAKKGAAGPLTATKPVTLKELAGDDPQFGALELTVRYKHDKSRAPGVYVKILTTAVGWDPQRVMKTDAKGVIRVARLRVGSVYVKAVRGGERSFRIEPMKTTRDRLMIPAGVQVEVLVTDGEDTPVRDAKVWLSERWRNNAGEVVGVTDERGRLSLAHVSPHCSVAVRCEGYVPSKLFPVRGEPGASADVRVRLKRGGGMLSGVVLDPDGQPVSRALVLVGPENPAYSHRAADGSWVPGPPPIQRVTDGKGRFEVRDAPSGEAKVQVRHADFAVWEGRIQTAPGAPVHETIRLQDGASVFGVVATAAGEPARFATVWVGKSGSFHARRTFANEAGEFELRGLSPGEQPVFAVKDGERAEGRLRFALGERLEWNPRLGAKAVAPDKPVLRGRVVDENDEPQVGWRVAARGDTSLIVSAHTDREGRFSLEAKSPELRVWAHAPGKHSGFPPVVRDGVRPADGELLLRVDSAAYRAATITGEVVDPSGRGVLAQIQVWHETLRMWRQFQSDSKTGRFSIDNLAPGKVDLKVVSEKFAWHRVPSKSVTAGQRLDLGRITLQSGGRITGTLQLGGAAPEKARVRVYFKKDGSEASVAEYVEGRYRTGVLAAGAYTLVVTGDRMAQKQLDVTIAGGDVTRDVALEPAALRVLEFQFAKTAKRPRFMSLTIHSRERGVVWGSGFGASGAMRANVSIPAGSYQLTVWGPQKRKWLETTLAVPSLEDAPVMRFKLQPRE